MASESFSAAVRCSSTYALGEGTASRQQAADARMGEPRRALGRRLDAQRHGTPSHRRARGSRAHHAPGDPRVDDLGERAEIPRRDARPLRERRRAALPGGCPIGAGVVPRRGRRRTLGATICGTSRHADADAPAGRRAGQRAGDLFASPPGEPLLQLDEVARGADGAPAVVDGAERHEQVRGHAFDLEVGGGHGLVRNPLDASVSASRSASAGSPRWCSGPSPVSSSPSVAAQSAAGTT